MCKHIVDNTYAVFPELFEKETEKFQTAKVTFKVIKGHRIGAIR